MSTCPGLLYAVKKTCSLFIHMNIFLLCFLNRIKSISPIHKGLIGITTPSQSESRGNDNKEIHHKPRGSRT